MLYPLDDNTVLKKAGFIKRQDSKDFEMFIFKKIMMEFDKEAKQFLKQKRSRRKEMREYLNRALDNKLVTEFTKLNYAMKILNEYYYVQSINQPKEYVQAKRPELARYAAPIDQSVTASLEKAESVIQEFVHPYRMMQRDKSLQGFMLDTPSSISDYLERLHL